MFRNALQNGYSYGVHIMGGAYALSNELMTKWKDNGDLDYPEIFERSYLGEDSVVTIMSYSAGFKLDCFNAEGEVFGVWYRQPEMSAQKLFDFGYSLIHSIKDVSPESEDILRREYRALLKEKFSH